MTNKDLFCIDCRTTKNVYPILSNDTVEPLCHKCIGERERIDVVKESGRKPLELTNPSFPHLTVKDIRDSLDGVPDSTPVLYQRIEDAYFDKHGWTTYKMMWDFDVDCAYILAWSAYWHSKIDAFVINAHY